MKNDIVGIKCAYGNGFDRSRLPDGWTIKESNDEFAVAVDPEGQEYYLTETHAIARSMKKEAYRPLHPNGVDDSIKPVPLREPS